MRQGFELSKIMKKHCVDSLDIFEHSLSIAKAVTLLLESEDKDLIHEINFESLLNFFNEFIEETKVKFGEKKEYLEAISEYVNYLSIMVGNSPTL